MCIHIIIHNRICLQMIIIYIYVLYFYRSATLRDRHFDLLAGALDPRPRELLHGPRSVSRIGEAHTGRAGGPVDGTEADLAHGHKVILQVLCNRSLEEALRKSF